MKIANKIPNNFLRYLVALPLCLSCGISVELKAEKLSSSNLQSADSQIVCAAIFVCNEDGTVPAPYNQGACASTYLANCLGSRIVNAHDELTHCEDSHAEIEGENKALKAELKRTRKLLRAAKRR